MFAWDTDYSRFAYCIFVFLVVFVVIGVKENSASSPLTCLCEGGSDKCKLALVFVIARHLLRF